MAGLVLPYWYELVVGLGLADFTFGSGPGHGPTQMGHNICGQEGDSKDKLILSMKMKIPIGTS